MPDSTSPHSSETSQSKAMVIIHGAGTWPDGYWNAIVAREPFHGLSFATVGVRYSQIFEAPQAPSAPGYPDAAKFQSDFVNLLAWERISSELSARGVASLTHIASLAQVGIQDLSLDPRKIILGALSRSLFGLDFVQLVTQIASTPFFHDKPIVELAQQVAAYLYDSSIAGPVRKQLVDGLQAAQAYDDIVLVSHSLGTIVAFDVLAERTELIPKISHWLTLGCPIHKVLLLRPTKLTVPLPHARIPNWFNLYDTSDFVGGALGPTFGLFGCFVHDIFVKVANEMPQAHDYFDNLASLEVIASTLR
ncbi:MAG: hypothetical protein M1482_04360 [Chloroflexi bacterium]|nr:hypothetical protein [Chloroflexota bacterium]